MPRKVIRLGKEAQESLRKGVDAVADAVKVTLGPSGRNGIIGHQFQTPEITNDGVSIANEIYLDDEIEQLGAEAMKEITRNADKSAGDGTTTATVLAQAIISAGFGEMSNDDPFVKKSGNPMSIKREIEEACVLVCVELDKQTKQISTLEEIEQVAFVSVENEKIAKIIAEMYFKIGKDGVVTVEDGYLEIESEVVEGLEIEAGLSNDYMANTEEKKFVADKPLILVTNERIELPEQIVNLTTALHEEGTTSLIIVADDFTKEMLESFVIAKMKGSISVIAVKAPYFGKKEKMQDIAIMVGAEFFDKEISNVSKATVESLGKAKKIIVDKDKTVILGAKGNAKERIAELTKELKAIKNPFDIDQMKKRLAKLSNGVGIIRVGAESQQDRGYLKKKIEDAVNATKYALQEGVVRGGGLALKEVSESLQKNILTDAILSPYKQIQDNAGGTLIIGENIFDPVRTTKTALKSACSVAALIITTEVAIADKFEKEKDFDGEE